uniref:Olfactomedin-like domain-containing protein n=1 Tax=Latimeria chalumnae TaxID=7897 RepID=H3BF33_LATCH
EFFCIYFYFILCTCSVRAVVYNVNCSLTEKHNFCPVTLPDIAIPVRRMEKLEILSHGLSARLQQQLALIGEYNVSLMESLQELQNLARRVRMVEVGVSFSELDFELLRLEVQRMKTTVVELRASLNQSNESIDKLYDEVQEILVMVSQLELSDKQNIMVVQQKIRSLRKRVQECREKGTVPVKSDLETGLRNCEHEGLLNVSKPKVVQLNWRGANYKYGGWGMDPSPASSKKEVYWVAPLNLDGRLLESFHLYTSYKDLLLYSNPIERRLSKYNVNTWDYRDCGQGSGMVMYRSHLYYNCYGTRSLCRVDIDAKVVERTLLSKAAYNNRFSYLGVSWQDLDFAVDESGLWVLYATEESLGKLVISKINVSSFSVEQTWVTTQYKPEVTNAFMICGVMYATRPKNTGVEEIFYTFDTKTGKHGSPAVLLDKVSETVQSLSYNPADRKLYMYSGGYEVTYEVIFKL